MEDIDKRNDVSVFKILRSLFKKDQRRDNLQEIQEIIEEVEEKGIIDEEQGDMIENIFVLKETAVKEIMVPKGDMIVIDVNASLDDAVKAINESTHSTIPVYDGSFDNVVGLIHAKDILRLWKQDDHNAEIRQLMRHAYFVPEGKKLIDLLQEFRQNRQRIAIVIDEFGNVDGLTTIRDIMEEIVGDIRSNDGQDSEDVIDLGEDVFEVDPQMSIDEFAEEFSVDFPEGDYDTIAGFITSYLQRIPKTGEALEFGGITFKIESASKRKIIRLIVNKGAPKK